MDLARQQKLFEAYDFQRQFAMWPLASMNFRLRGVEVSADALAAFHTPPPPADEIAYAEGVVYGTAGESGRDLKLYLYARKERVERRPAVIFVHGGAWVMGHPVLHLRQAQYLAAQGYVTAVIFYRLAPEAPWPAALEDCKCSVRWLRAHAGELGVDPNRIAIAGESAGGHLTYLVALTSDGEYEGSGGWSDESSAVQAAIPISGLFDWAAPDINPMISEFLGNVTDERLREISPVTHVSSSCPPILSMVGGKEDMVEGLRAFHKEVDALGVMNELAVFDDQVHGFTLLPEQWQLVVDRMQAFLEARMGPTAGSASRA